MGPVYYFPGRPFKTISSAALKFYISFQKVTSERLEHCEFFYPQGHSCISPYQTQNNLYYLQKIEIIKVNSQINRNVVVPTVCSLSKHFNQIICQRFGHGSIVRLKKMTRKRIMEGLPKISLTWSNPDLFFS